MGIEKNEGLPQALCTQPHSRCCVINRRGGRGSTGRSSSSSSCGSWSVSDTGGVNPLLHFWAMGSKCCNSIAHQSKGVYPGLQNKQVVWTPAGSMHGLHQALDLANRSSPCSKEYTLWSTVNLALIHTIAESQITIWLEPQEQDKLIWWHKHHDCEWLKSTRWHCRWNQHAVSYRKHSCGPGVGLGCVFCSQSVFMLFASLCISIHTLGSWFTKTISVFWKVWIKG